MDAWQKCEAQLEIITPSQAAPQRKGDSVAPPTLVSAMPADQKATADRAERDPDAPGDDPPLWRNKYAISLAALLVTAMLLAMLRPPFACDARDGVRAPSLRIGVVAGIAIVVAVLVLLAPIGARGARMVSEWRAGA